MNARAGTAPAAPLSLTAPNVSAVMAGVRRIAIQVWQSLERAGQQRAARELVLTAARFEGSDPELALQLRRYAREWLPY